MSVGTIVANADTDYIIPEIADVDIIDGNRIDLYNLDSGSGVYMNGYYFADYRLIVSIYDTSLYSASNNFEDDLYSAMNEINLTVNYIDTLANTTYTESDIYAFNMADSGDTVSISDTTALMIQYAQEMYEITNGYYNPAVMRLADLWGFSTRIYSYGNIGVYDYDRSSISAYSTAVPDSKYIDAFVELCDFSTVLLEGSAGSYTLTKTCDNVTVDGVEYSQWIDLGGIAKGYATELVADILEKYGYEHYYISCGGSSLVLSTVEDGSSFNLGIEVPNSFFSTYYAGLSVADAGVSTSGIYNKYYVIDGVQYGHIIDGTTGYPVTEEISTLTVVGANAWATDCLSTALIAMGVDNMTQFVNNGGLTAVDELCGTSDLVVIGLYLYDTDSYGIIANISSEQLTYLNDDYPFVSQMTESGIVIVLPADNSYTWLIVLASVLAAAAIGVLLYVRFHHRRGDMYNVDHVRQGKFFVKSDIIVYAVLAVAIVALLWVFVFSVVEEAYSQLQIVDTMTDSVLFVYDRDTGEVTVPYSSIYRIEQSTDEDGTLYVAIYLATEEDDENYLNILAIYADGTAEMVEANCGIHEECITTFGAIENVGDIIVCSPNSIKVVGLGD